MNEPELNEPQLVLNRVKTVSSGLPGRSISEVRQHLFVVDDPSIGQAMTAADYFVSDIAACAVNHMEVRAENDGISLRKIEVELEARRDAADTSVFLGIDFNITFYGVSQPEADALLAAYKSH